MQPTKYRAIWQGKCIANEGQVNLEKGEVYLLKERLWESKSYNVYQIPNNRFLGCYKGEYFETINEVSEEEADSMMKHPVNYFGVDEHDNVVRTPERPNVPKKSINTTDEVETNEKPKKTTVKQPDKKEEFKKPVQRTLFG